MFLRTYVCLKTSRVRRYEYVEEVVIVFQAAGPACVKVLRQEGVWYVAEMEISSEKEGS